MAKVERELDFEFTKDTPYIILMGEIIGGFIVTI